MQQRRLQSANFAKYAIISFVLNVIISSFGAVDMIMVASLGAGTLAAIGLGELITATAFAVLSGYADLYVTTLARQVGKCQRSMQRTNLLFMSAAICLTVIFILAALAVGPLLGTVFSGQAIGQGVATYVAVRFVGVGFHLLSFGFVEALKIRGYPWLAFAPVGLGFLINIIGNAVVLHTPIRKWLPDLESGIAASTVVAQLMMVVFAWALWTRLPAPRRVGARASNLAPNGPTPGFIQFMQAGFSIGGRNLNDYIANLAPLIFIASMGAERAAAAAVATKLATLFYRMPQSCFGASLVFYSFTVDQFTHRPERARRMRLRRLALYSAVPTCIFAVTFLLLSDPLARLFSKSVDPAQIAFLLSAYMIFVPTYFAEQFLAELLAAHRQDMVMVLPSTLATFVLALPLAYVSAIYLESAFLAIASRGVAAVPLAIYYWLRLRPYLADRTAVTP